MAQLILENLVYGEPHDDERADLMQQAAGDLSAAVEFFYQQAASPEPNYRAQTVALLAPVDGRSLRYRELLTAIDVPAEHPLVIEAVRDAECYLADVDGGERPPLGHADLRVGDRPEEEGRRGLGDGATLGAGKSPGSPSRSIDRTVT